MTTFSEQQWNAHRMLLCVGDSDGEQHITPLPRVDDTYGVQADLRCSECGGRMQIVDVLTIERDATLGHLDYLREAPLYTTAKLHPVALMSAMARSDKFDHELSRTGVDSHTPPRPQPRKEDATP